VQTGTTIDGLVSNISGSSSAESEAVHLFTSTHPNCENDHLMHSAIDAVDDARVACPYPATASQVTAQRLTDLVRLTMLYPLVDDSHNGARLSGSNGLQIPRDGGVISYIPAH